MSIYPFWIDLNFVSIWSFQHYMSVYSLKDIKKKILPDVDIQPSSQGGRCWNVDSHPTFNGVKCWDAEKPTFTKPPRVLYHERLVIGYVLNVRRWTFIKPVRVLNARRLPFTQPLPGCCPVRVCSICLLAGRQQLAVLYTTAQLSIVQYSTVQYGAVQQLAVLFLHLSPSMGD